MGLDPDPLLMPISSILKFNQAIVDATADLVCAYKPNMAFYEAQGIQGLKDLRDTVGYISKTAPHAVIIGDGKRGDIGSTARAYATAMFETWGFHAATVSPYLGEDSVQPFLEYEDRGIFVLCRTSNPGSADFQGLAAPSAPLYQRVASEAARWNTRGNVGLVVGATRVDELREVRRLCPHLPILIPGVGAQGGDLEGSVRFGLGQGSHLALINSSRGVIFASRGADFAEQARNAAMGLRDQINAVLEEQGRGWS